MRAARSARKKSSPKKGSTEPHMETFFVVTAPGLENITSQEMRSIGLLPKQAKQRREEWKITGEEGGGVVFEGSFDHLYRANLRLRTASRVLVRLGEFHAVAFPELVIKAAGLAWERYLTPGQPVTLHVTCHKSRLYHSDAVAERVLAAIRERLGKSSRIQKSRPNGAPSPAQRIVVRFVNDQCTISVDSSGELLHRRGYRLETAKAPLRETLAAAVLLASGWEPSAPLLDPFCGSGTIAIEAALIALGRPPGADRRFAFMDWPGYDPTRWEATQSAAAQLKRQVEGGSPLIFASDRDAGAVRISQANAERAGVEGLIRFTQHAVSAIEPPATPGWVVTNPPYGLRISASKDVRNLYAQFGNVLRDRCPGWQVTVLSNDLHLLGQLGFPLDTALSTLNGGVGVRIARGQVPPAP
jgi:putative N6-adenine-specific DNA methylase